MSSLSRQTQVAAPSTQCPPEQGHAGPGSHEHGPTSAQSVGPAAGAGHGNAAAAQGVGLTGNQPAAGDQGQIQKSQLLSTPFYGPMDLAHAISPGSGVGIGGFQASYIPAVSLLIIRVTGKVQFKNAISGAHPSFTTEHSDLNNLVTFMNALPAATAAQVLPFFQWSATDKADKLTQFNARLREASSIWQGTGMHFEVNDPAWTDVTASPVFSLEVGEEGTAGAGDHLQVSIYKEPTAAEKAQIDALLIAAGQAAMNPNIQGIRANAGTNVGSNAPGATGSATDENALQNEMSLSSSDLEATNDPNERGGNNMLKKTILFGHDDDTLTGAQITDIQGWIVRYNDGDSIAANNRITLRGFASAAGDPAHNRQLTDKRISSVQTAITGAGVAAGRITRENRGDAEARTPAVGADAAAQANERRVEIRIGSGERQNTVAHEFGHVFGLSDEYTEGSRTPGQQAWHNPTAVAAGVTGGAPVEESDNIISVGNTVRPQHYSTFAWALNQLTASKLGGRLWHVKE
jgi:outer membrane protein OmpA-like peptidoglycan-associated protein